MTSSYRQIAVFPDASPEGRRLFTQAALLAKRMDADLVSLIGVERSSTTPAESFTRGHDAIRALIQRRNAADQSRALEGMTALEDIASAVGHPCDFEVVWTGASGDDPLRFLECDLMVAAHPRPHAQPIDWTAEGLLLRSGGPVLLIPSAWGGERPGDHVVIAWNGSRQARNAVSDALPFLRTASSVTVLTVDADLYAERVGARPGPDLIAYLGRLGIEAGLHAVRSGESSIAGTIATETRALGADLTVVGCYSRSRTLETIFGGVTRTLLHDAASPLLLSF